MEIRRLRSGDEGLVARLAKERRGLGTPPTTLIPFLSDPRTMLYIAMEGDEILGYIVAYELDKFYGDKMLLVYDVEVVEAHHRKRIGTALLDTVKAYCAANGLNSMWLSTSRDDPRARGFYDSLGGSVQEDVVYWWRFDREPADGKPAQGSL